MRKMIGIRREDKNKWERRVPIVPEDITQLYEQYGIHAVVQPSDLRIFPDEAFKVPGVVLDEDLNQADTIFAVKEIPTKLLAPKKTYIFFSHTIKGQSYNMGLLKRLMELECNLIDYERIVNEKNQRLIFFGAHAGYAGMIETLFAYAEKMKKKGIDSPLSGIRQAYEYESLEDAKNQIKKIGERIAFEGLPKEISPLVVGFAGYGNVSGGAQEIFDLLPFREIPADRLSAATETYADENTFLLKVVFKEEHMVKHTAGSFDLQDYYTHPQNYESVMPGHLPHLDILVNCIYWTPDYPRLVTREYLKSRTDPKPCMIGDISCDIEGSIEITRDATMPDNACFTYFPESDSFEDGIAENGVTVMAIDNLPCEFSKEASQSFSSVLKDFANDIVSADFSKPFDQLSLPYPIKKALILHNGKLTDDYKYLEQYL